ncbi:MAG: hypothetical protein GY795_51445 [Desulfobacterales bacterium]|nr:hypothetical protein [Desulfobacterales bacterium]
MTAVKKFPNLTCNNEVRNSNIHLAKQIDKELGTWKMPYIPDAEFIDRKTIQLSEEYPFKESLDALI